MKHIFLVEDDREIAGNLTLLLKAEGFAVTHASTQAEAVSALTDSSRTEKPFDLALVDISLPDGNGFAVCTEVKQSRDIPVIFLTASGDEASVVTGLNIGADDYITKPFNPVEVSARVKSQLRRYMQLGAGSRSDEVLRCGGIELDDTRKKVSLDGETVALTPTEYEILKLLMQHQGKVFSPREIYQKIWKDLPYGSENTVAVHIRHIREKLEINPAEPRYLKVVWGQGYKCEKTFSP